LASYVLSVILQKKKKSNREEAGKEKIKREFIATTGNIKFLSFQEVYFYNYIYL
jgi:hypothetical protein